MHIINTDCLNKVVEISHDYEKVYDKLGLIKYRLEDYRGAINDFSFTIRYFPDDINAYYFRGLSKIKILDFESAILDFNKILDINPNNELAIVKTAYVKYLQEKYDEAIDLYTKVIVLNENSGEAYFYRGLSKYKKGDKKEGCIDLDLANKFLYIEAYDEFVESMCN
jgi:tetratricopeptide (TPR) repeat protein